MSIAIVNKKTILVLLLVSIAFIGCDMRAPSSEDLSRLEVLKKKYENDLKFELAEEIYLNVHQKHEAVKVDKDLSNIYKEFFMNGDNLREDSKFIYLNLYDSKKQFLYQLYYDVNTRLIRKEYTEHY